MQQQRSKRPTVSVVCRGCGTTFQAFTYVAARGAAWYCSRRCFHTYRTRPLAIRFWSKVNKDGPVPAHCPEFGPCWLWTGARYGNGYGEISVSPGKNQASHRVSWTLHNGVVPDGVFVLHKCDTRLCVNPDHLFLGTPLENVRDMMCKGRQVFGGRTSRAGERNANAKLTNDSVRAIRLRYSKGGVSQPELASEYGVSHTVISHLIRRKSWKHVD